MAASDKDSRDRNERAILDHVELYRLTIAPSIERLLFPADEYPGDEARGRAVDALEELVRRGKLLAREFPKAKGAMRGASYYVLPAAKALDDAQGINFDLQTLWLSTLTEHRYYRLTKPEIARLFATPPHHHVRHVVGDVGDGPFVARVYPSAVPVKETVARVKQFMSEARGKHGLASWVDAGDYGFCILVDNQRKVEAVGEAMMARRQGGGALADEARIQVAFAPTAGVVSQAIDEL